MKKLGTVNSEEKYQQAIDILTSQGRFHINLGLERIEKILELLDNPQKKLKYIHIAGTNGKGSVCAMLNSILTEVKRGSKPSVIARSLNDEANQENLSTYQLINLSTNNPFLRVGLFTSPHIFEYTERIKINDVEIEKELFAKKVIEINDLAEKNKIHLTEFEILTAVAFDYFAENHVDIVILETGLGGRFDATNIIEKSICSVITNIDFDHTERLGNTIEKIAFEKAGIIKPDCTMVISKKNKGFKIIKKIAKKNNSPLLVTEKAPNFPNCNLKGTYQQENLALVLTVIKVLNKNGFEITQEMVEKGLKSVNHHCRFEFLSEKNLIIDGAHNPSGTKALRESLDEAFPNEGFNFIFGCLKNKDYPQMIKNLFTQNDDIYFYTFDNQNACSYEELSKVCKFNSNRFNKFESETGKKTVICGSLYMIKELSKKMGIK